MGIIKQIAQFLLVKDEKEMWKMFNSVMGMADVHYLKGVGQSEEDFYVCVDGDDVCILMMDSVTREAAIADEEAFSNQYPLYFSESSHRVSPVFRLWALCEGVRKHEAFREASVSGILFTSTNILNLEDVKEEWDRMDISVRPVRTWGYDRSLRNADDDWKGLTTYLTGKKIERFVNLGSYNDMRKNWSDVQVKEKKMEPVPSETKPKELRLEDIVDRKDPIFHTLGADGNSEFVSANLPPMRVFAPTNDASARLDEMVGLDEIKTHLAKLKNLVAYRKMLKGFKGIYCPEVSLHSVFKGSPGTGKTSVGLLYASLLKEAGILSRGYLLLANGRDSFMGRWVGSEEKNVRMALAAAKGNVLMIDEAYTLVSPNEMDYSRNVLPLMLQLLADEEYRDVAVILCGYTSEMECLLQSNPGLRARFPHLFLFPDYSVEQLKSMAVTRIQKSGYTLSKDAEVKLEDVLQQMYRNRVEPQWANGREVTNLFDRIMISHADRCVCSSVEGEMLLLITPEDIPDCTDHRQDHTKRIGFH